MTTRADVIYRVPRWALAGPVRLHPEMRMKYLADRPESRGDSPYVGGPLETLFGFPIIVDDMMPTNAVDFGDGVKRYRMIVDDDKP